MSESYSAEAFHPKVAVHEISGIPVAYRKTVIDRATNLIPNLVNWNKAYPAISVERIPSTALACYATIPDAAELMVNELAKLSLIIFALDDVIDKDITSLTIGTDSGNASPNQAQTWLEFYEALVRQVSPNSVFEPLVLSVLDQLGIPYPTQLVGPAVPPALQVAKALVECLQTLQKFKQGELYHSLFMVEKFARVMRSMSQELLWQQHYQQSKGEELPTCIEYLENGIVSIAAPIISTSLMEMLMQEPLKNPNAQIISDIEYYCGKVIRLANDIQSFKREETAGKPNSLLIRVKREGLTLAQAQVKTLEEINSSLQYLDNLTQTSPLELKDWAVANLRLAHFSRDFYLVSDFHIFSKKMLAKLATSL